MAKGKKTGGRKRGTPNKLTTNVREAILSAFGSVGGAKYLEKQARENPQAFLTLLGKVLPTQITGKDDTPLLPQSGVLMVPVAPSVDDWAKAAEAVSAAQKDATKH